MRYDIINNNYNKFGGKYDMKELTTKDMTEYLKNVMELESSIYCQEETIQNMKLVYRNKVIEQSNKLFYLKEKPIIKKKEIAKPENPKDTRLYNPVEAEKSAHKNQLRFSMIGIIPVLIGICIHKRFVIGIGLFIIVFYLILAKISKSKISQLEAKELRLDLEYESKIAEYEQQVAVNEQEYETKLKEREQTEKQAQMNVREAETAQREADKMIEEEFGVPLTQTRQLLEKMYDLGVIFPKYRNWVAISTIYEYFATGRCTTLVGADGAYNLYESELRQNLIIGKLDEIVKQLEIIKQNQYTLFTELNKTNYIIKEMYNNTKKIVDSIENIEDTVQEISHSSYITSYCAQVTAQNTEALKYITLING